MATRAVATMRTRCPAPSVPPLEGASPGHDDGDGVGGAVLMAHGGNQRWPSETSLAAWLQKLHPYRRPEHAWACACDLMHANDQGDLDEAGALAEKVLHVGRPPGALASIL